MTLRRIIEFVRAHEKELCLFNVDPGDGIADDLAAYFETQNVRVRTERTATGRPPGVAVLSSDDAVLATADVSTLRGLLDTVPDGSSGAGVGDAAYDQLLGHLKETTFTSTDREQLLYASREIEDRARRVGAGTLHAGFQRVSRLADQTRVYADLAGRGVAVHAYGVPDAPVPDIGPGRVHTVETDEIARSWFVAFDGDGDETQKTALLAREREPDEFYGAWTYDPAIVDRTVEYLEGTYLESGSEQEPSPGD